MDEKIKRALIDIVGEDGFTDKLIDLIAYSRDASPHKHSPDAAVWVTTAEQVSQILRLANHMKFPVIARGAGTGLAGLCVPQKGGLVIDMIRMDRIVEINIADRVAVVQPGVLYADLEKALTPHGFFFPPDPASGKVCTLGGNVATNAGGMKGAKYGTTKDYVLALEVVLPDGRILRTGSRCMKSVSGYDLTKLFVGSEGTLGVITEITLKVNPRPPLTSTAMATFDDVEAAGRAISRIMRSGVLPSALEVVDGKTLQAVKQFAGLEIPDAAILVVGETDGYTPEETEFQMARIVDIFKECQATTVRLAGSAKEAESIWATRRFAGPAGFRLNNNLFVEDLSVPMSRLSQALKVIWDLSRKFDIKISTVGHAGDGNLHPSIAIDASIPEEVEKMRAASVELYEHIIGMGGTLTGEHGIGLAKAPFMNMEHNEISMDVMRSLKKLFDPNNILNPGKMSLDEEDDL